MFVIAEKEEQMHIIFFLFIFGRSCPRSFKQRLADRVQTMKAQTNRPRSQNLSTVVSIREPIMRLANGG